MGAELSTEEKHQKLFDKQGGGRRRHLLLLPRTKAQKRHFSTVSDATEEAVVVGSTAAELQRQKVPLQISKQQNLQRKQQRRLTALEAKTSPATIKMNRCKYVFIK
jgi:hypothetical protein